MQPHSTTPTFTIDNDILDQYGALLGPFGLAIYATLARYADTNQHCQIPVQQLATVTGMSKRQAHRILGELADFGLITIVRHAFPGTNENRPNHYILLPVTPRATTLPTRKRLTTRDRVLAKNDGRCVYCGAPADTIDHVIPRSKGGTHDLDNLVPACHSCNTRKGVRLDWSPE